MILYLHGFDSSPQSNKAQLLKTYLERSGRAPQFECPALPHEPDRAVRLIEDAIARRAGRKVTLVGSSLGGYYATWFAEKYALSTVLLNPAIAPHRDLRPYLGKRQTHRGGESFELTQAHLDQLERLFVPRVDPERYLLLVETGDEILDYRAAVRRYLGARQVVVQGGDHALSSFPEHIPMIVAFAGLA